MPPKSNKGKRKPFSKISGPKPALSAVKPQYPGKSQELDYCLEEERLLTNHVTEGGLELWVKELEAHITQYGGMANYPAGECFGTPAGTFQTRSNAVCGDLNGDGGHNVLDIVTLANCILAENCADLEYGCAGDLNQDGGWNVLDIVTLANCVLVGNCGEDPSCCDGGGEGCNGETTHGGCFSSRENAQGVSHPYCKNHSDAALCSVLGGVHRIGYNCGQCDDYGNNCSCCAGITCPPSCTGGAPFSTLSQCYNEVDGSGGPASNTNICCNPTTGYCDPDFGFVESSCGHHSYCNTPGNACTIPTYEPGTYCSMWQEAEQEMCQNNLLPSNNTSCTSISDCDYWQDIYGNCYDPKEWTGSSCHMTCDVFDAVGCSVFGSLVGANGYTANEMCCACGGGNNPVDGTINDDFAYWWEGYFDCDINAGNAHLGYRNDDGSWNYHCAARGGFETWIEDDWPHQQGDGTCDDHGGAALSVNLMCEEFDFDGGDCGGAGSEWCPNGSCSGDPAYQQYCVQNGSYCSSNCQCPGGWYCDGYYTCWVLDLDLCGCWPCGMIDLSVPSDWPLYDTSFPCEIDDSAEANGEAYCADACGGDCQACYSDCYDYCDGMWAWGSYYCWCDDQCESYGDCCPNACSECGYDCAATGSGGKSYGGNSQRAPMLSMEHDELRGELKMKNTCNKSGPKCSNVNVNDKNTNPDGGLRPVIKKRVIR